MAQDNPTQTAYNLDDVQESFTFTLKGHQYRFRHMTTPEMEEMGKLKDDVKAQEYLYQFITPEGDAPEFPEVAKVLIVPHWKAFRNMLESEFSIEKK